jgi:bile acid:Na+ symporter, BASS family
MTPTLLLLLKLSVVTIILAIGMSSTMGDVSYLLRRPGLLLRSVVAMYVLVPLTALVLVKTFTLAPGVEIALLVFAVSAGAPLLPRKLMNIGDGAYTFSLVVLSTLLAIILVPTWLTLLGPEFGNPLELTPGRIAMVFAKSFFLPLVLGMLVYWLFPKFAEQVGDRLMMVAGLVLTACALVLLVLNWNILLEARGPSLLILAVLIFSALTIGHMLGGPSEDDRTSLAIACATRHIGIAVLVAASVPGPRTAVLVAAYIVTAATISIPYLRWRRSTCVAEVSL